MSRGRTSSDSRGVLRLASRSWGLFGVHKSDLGLLYLFNPENQIARVRPSSVDNGDTPDPYLLLPCGRPVVVSSQNLLPPSSLVSPLMLAWATDLLAVPSYSPCP